VIAFFFYGHPATHAEETYCKGFKDIIPSTVSGENKAARQKSEVCTVDDTEKFSARLRQAILGEKNQIQSYS
jgi:hypothetical protein